MAEGTERVAGTDCWKAKKGTVEPRQEVVSVNQGTDTENSGCDSYSEASFDEDYYMRIAALVKIKHGAIWEALQNLEAKVMSVREELKEAEAC